MDRLLGGLFLRPVGLGGILRALLTVLALALAGPAMAAEGQVAVPSGQMVLPYEALWEDHPSEGEGGETWLILRFLAPEIAKVKGKFTYGDAAPDIDHLCQEIGLPLAAMTGDGVDQIIVTLMDQPLPRGARDTAVTQFMSAYRVTEGACIWE